jgi:U3 small nucleolar RNA-associated protein 25
VNELLKIYGEKKLTKKSRKERFETEYEDPDRAEEDDFRLAISITNKGLKLFTPFSTCDIIIASLVGLRLATSASEEKKERDFSFLSSVEILVIDRAHALYMQNWQHMNELIGLFNRVPKHKAVTNSIHSIREYFFENLSRFYR